MTSGALRHLKQSRFALEEEYGYLGNKLKYRVPYNIKMARKNPNPDYWNSSTKQNWIREELDKERPTMRKWEKRKYKDCSWPHKADVEEIPGW